MDKQFDEGIETTGVRRVRRLGAETPEPQIPKKDPLPRFRFPMPGRKKFVESIMVTDNVYNIDHIEEAIYLATTYLNQYVARIRRALKRGELNVKFEPFVFRAYSKSAPVKLEGVAALETAWHIMDELHKCLYEPCGVSHMARNRSRKNVPTTMHVVRKYLKKSGPVPEKDFYTKLEVDWLVESIYNYFYDDHSDGGGN